MPYQRKTHPHKGSGACRCSSSSVCWALPRSLGSRQVLGRWLQAGSGHVAATSAQVVQRGSQPAAQHADMGDPIFCAALAGQPHSLQL